MAHTISQLPLILVSMFALPNLRIIVGRTRIIVGRMKIIADGMLDGNVVYLLCLQHLFECLKLLELGNVGVYDRCSNRRKKSRQGRRGTS